MLRTRDYKRQIMATTKVVKVAVVGSGLAGLTAAYLLTQQQQGDVRFDVHIFEKAPALGMDSSSISLPIPGKEKTWRVDVPMRSFQGGYYKQLMALYRKLGVAFVERDFTYSFSTLLPSGILTEMIYNGSSGLKGVSVPSKQRSMVWFAFWVLGLIFCYIRLLLLSLPFMRPRGVERMSYASWVEQCSPKGVVARWTGFTRAWTGFTRVVLVPLFSAVCTAPEEEIWNHPVEELLDYIWLTLGTHHYVVQNGVRDVVARLAARVENIHLSSPIVALRPDENDPDLVSLHCEGKVHTGFQHVVFATQANRCVPLLTSYAEALPENKNIRRQAIQKQIDCLDNFGYSSTIVINHTDERLLPQDPRDHRDLNLIYIPSPSPRTSPSHPTTKGKSPKCLPPSYTMTTQVLPHPEGFPSHLPAVYQTTNPTVEPREGRILSVAALERAVLSLPAKEAVKGLYVRRSGEDRLGVLQGGGGKGSGPGIWICGSYAYSGIPLLEGCVVSARLVVQQGIWRREGVRNRAEPW